MHSPAEHYRWLAVAGLSLMLQVTFAQNAPAPAPAPGNNAANSANAANTTNATTAIPAARPATGNATTPAQAKPNTAAAQPATAAPKTAEPPKAPPAAASKPLDAKSAATPSPTPPAAAAQDKPADAASDTMPEAPPKKKAGAEPPPCIVADFRAIGVDTQDAEKRRARALNWVARRGKQCTAQQLLVMRNNRSQWLGTGDSGAVAASIDALLEAFAATNPDIALLLYGTPPPPPPPPDPKDKKAAAK